MLARSRKVRELIFERCVEASQMLDCWARNYPAMRRELIWPLALSVAPAAPFASRQDIAVTAKVSLWVFALDDLFDESCLPKAELKASADRFQAIARDHAETGTGDGTLAHALQTFRRELAQYPLFHPLERQWVDSLKMMRNLHQPEGLVNRTI